MATRKSSSTRARRPAARPRRINPIPRAVWRGKVQSRDFGRGTQAAKYLLAWLETHPDASDAEGAELVQEKLVAAARERFPAYFLGFTAALGVWLAEARHSQQQADGWVPFPTPPIERRGREYPPSEHRLFRLVNTPLSMGPGHDTYAWDGDRARTIDSRTVLEGLDVITPIDRKEFDRLRRA